MKQALNALSRQLNDIEFDIFEFETSLVKFVARHSARSIRPLLTLFRDNYQNDEALFSIVHSIESFENSVYCREIVLGLKDLQKASEQWLLIIVQRISNDSDCYNSFCDYASAATDPETNSALKNAILSMRKNSPDSNWQRISSDLKLNLN